MAKRETSAFAQAQMLAIDIVATLIMTKMTEQAIQQQSHAGLPSALPVMLHGGSEGLPVPG